MIVTSTEHTAGQCTVVTACIIPCKLKPDKIQAWRGGHYEALALAEELLVADNFKEREGTLEE